VPYLTEEAIFSTLGCIASLPGGARVVFDYGNPAVSPGPDPWAADREALAQRVASVGESLRSHFETHDLHARLTALGLRVVEDLGPALMRERFLGAREDALPDRGGHILLAIASR